MSHVIEVLLSTSGSLRSIADVANYYLKERGYSATDVINIVPMSPTVQGDVQYATMFLRSSSPEPPTNPSTRPDLGVPFEYLLTVIKKAGAIETGDILKTQAGKYLQVYNAYQTRSGSITVIAKSGEQVVFDPEHLVEAIS